MAEHPSSDSMTPSDSSGSEHSEHDSDYETDDEETSNVMWTGYGRKIAIVKFDAESVLAKRDSSNAIGQKYHMTFKMESADCRIVRTILTAHGFKEANNTGEEYNIVWTGSQLKPFTLRNMTEYQRVNHFPRSYEITRKDRLYRNVQRMQQSKGFKHYDFVAQSYILPSDYQEFCASFMKEKGLFIVKPVASSRGRGVYLISHPEQIPMEENLIVSRYLARPLLIDGFKFDIRLYVAVTSYDPLVIYLYEEGLTRFATIKYNKQTRYMNHQCMHLTNYSVNKKNKDYVKNDDPEVEDYGNKWSFGALLRYLKSTGHDTSLIMSRIESVIIKTIIAAEMPIATACRMFMPFKSNCFELYGFDILVDENLKPWVLEVNLSPSLACDSPLDLKIKVNMLCDLFSLSGVVCHDPVQKASFSSKRFDQRYSRAKRQRPQSAGSLPQNKCAADKSLSKITSGLTGEEIKIVRRLREERERSAGWVCVFPNPDSWDQYGNLLQFNTTHNLMLHQRLYPNRHKGIATLYKPFGVQTIIRFKPRCLLQTAPKSKTENEEAALLELENRTRQYLRMLGEGQRRRRRRRARHATVVNGVKAGDDRLIADEEGDDDEAVPVFNVPISPHPPSTTPLRDHTVTMAPALLSDIVPSVIVKNHKPISEYKQNFDVVSLLLEGYSMSKVQARQAFAIYLVRVQQRLMNGDGDRTPDDQQSGLNEQMNLVVKFLKRAAVNLQQPFKVIIPSHKLAMVDRRRILSKVLGDFIHIYNKETEQIHRKAADTPVEANTGTKFLDKGKFIRFTAIASEAELESVLTTFTQIHKSASIFLGDHSQRGRQAVRAPSLDHQQAASVLSQVVNHKNNVTTSTTVPANKKISAYTQSKYNGMHSAHSTLTMQPKAISGGDNATNVDVLTPVLSESTTRLEKVVVVRPADYYNEKAISEALQRLTTKQQARQYSAHNSTSNIAQQEDTTSVTTNLRLRSWSSGDVRHDSSAFTPPSNVAPTQKQTRDAKLPEKPAELNDARSDPRSKKPPVAPLSRRMTPACVEGTDLVQHQLQMCDVYKQSSGANPRPANAPLLLQPTIRRRQAESKIRDPKSSSQLRRQNWREQLKATERHVPKDAKVQLSQPYTRRRSLLDVKGEVGDGESGAGGRTQTARQTQMSKHRLLMEQSRALLVNSQRKHEEMVMTAQRGEMVYMPTPPPPRSK